MPDLKDVENLYDEYMSKIETSIPEIDVPTILKLLEQGQSVVFVDVRDEEERAISMISDAISKYQYEQIADSLPESSVVVIYCTIGYRSGLYVKTLLENNRRNVYNLKGSILAWTFYQPVLDPNTKSETLRLHVWGPSWAMGIN